MYVEKGLLDEFFSELALKVKQLFERVRKRLRKAPKKRRRRRQPAASRAGKVLAKKRWSPKKGYRYPKIPIKPVPTSSKLH